MRVNTMAVPGEVHVLSAVTAAGEAMDVTLKDKQREAVVSNCMVHERIRRFRVFSH